jgi:hypothetical protein
MKICSVEECNLPHRCKGYCQKHYIQVRKFGYPLENSLRDFNEIVNKITYYELILTNNKMKEIGRAKIDLEDLEKVRSIGRWTLDNTGYVTNSHSDIKMHRLIMNAGSKDIVDHRKTGKIHKSDNRKKNLRLCTQAQNSCNQSKSKRNTSGFKGVIWIEKSKKWQAQVSHKGKRYKSEKFNTIGKAVKEYERLAKLVFGEFFNSG